MATFDPVRLVHLAWEYRDNFLTGAGVTFALTITSTAIAAVAGLALCLLGMARPRAARILAVIFTEFFRNTPILVLVVWVHFAVPDMIGLKLTAYASAIAALALQTTAYLAEEYRAGIEGVPAGQVEAARALGLPRHVTLRKVVLPQALRAIAPGLMNQFVLCFKSTSVVSVIAVPDIMYYATVIVNETFLSMYIYTIAALLYFVLVLIVSLACRIALQMEARRRIRA
ncbi:amino acid ABC transporter permease [Roseomonas chloroacetimidivorans]|uniref:amino acid ABC transporter permease n=1 Tax=Roseomonas chloroacetimidivorans TaxID=1766656 RepID=UPI003C750D20